MTQKRSEDFLDKKKQKKTWCITWRKKKEKKNKTALVKKKNKKNSSHILKKNKIFFFLQKKYVNPSFSSLFSPLEKMVENKKTLDRVQLPIPPKQKKE